MEWSEACTLGKRTTADLWSVRASARRNSHCTPTRTFNSFSVWNRF